MTTARLAKDLARLLEGQLNHDVVIRVGQGANTKEFPAHVGLLRARSPYFDVALSSRWVQADRNEPIIFEKPDVSPATFGVVLRYIYTGQIDWEQVDKDPLAMVMTADELLLDELLDLVQGHLIEKRAGWLSENNAYVLNVVVDRDTCSKLRDHALGIISADASTLFKSDSFIHLQASIVKGLVQRDDLPIAEFELWQGLVRWAVANTGREVATDPSIWSPEDREAVRRIMQDFIPYVRFYDISGPDFLDGVLPLKMLPKKLKWDLIKFHIDSSRKPKEGVLPTRGPSIPHVDSVLIKPHQVALIQKWINNGNNGERKAEWKLLYRASRDGFGANTFHNHCDNKGPTVTIVKRQGIADIVGGYTPLSWSSRNKAVHDSQ